MSIESRYRLVLGVSTLRRWFFLAPAGLLAVYTPAFSDAVWSWVWAPAYVAGGMVFLLILWLLQRKSIPQHPLIVMMSDTGRWEVLQPEGHHAQWGPRQLTPASKATALAVYLDFEHMEGCRSYQWVLANECSAQDFRRLVRIIRNLHTRGIP